MLYVGCVYGFWSTRYIRERGGRKALKACQSKRLEVSCSLHLSLLPGLGGDAGHQIEVHSILFCEEPGSDATCEACLSSHAIEEPLAGPVLVMIIC